MNKAIDQNIDRRAIMRGAAFSTVAAAIPATIAAAIGATPALAEAADPILEMVAERTRQRALMKAAGARVAQIRSAWNADDLAGSGWPKADFTRPELEVMQAWLKQGRWWDGRVSRKQIEDYNGYVETWAAKEAPNDLADFQADGVDRLAWFDERQAARERNAEISGYNRESEACDVIVDKVCDIDSQICDTTATSIAGALAKLAVVAHIIRIDHTHASDGSLDTDDEVITGLLGVIADLERFGILAPLAGSAVQS